MLVVVGAEPRSAGEFLGDRFWLKIGYLAIKKIALCSGEPFVTGGVQTPSNGSLGSKSLRSPLSPTSSMSVCDSSQLAFLPVRDDRLWKKLKLMTSTSFQGFVVFTFLPLSDPLPCP